MKELFLITAHIPDDRRESMLRNFVEKLQNYDYDIMVCSHTPLPKDILNKINYFIYERENRLLTKFNEKFNLWYGTEYFRIISTEVSPFNHMAAIIRSLGLGLKTAKDMGYEKVHYFEYDTDFDHLDEIVENSKLLDEYDSVYYLASPAGPNSPASLNLNRISKKWFEYSHEHINEWVEKLNFKTIESYELKLFEESNNIVKNADVLTKNGIKNALNSLMSFDNWDVLFSEKENLKFFSLNQNQKEKKINLIINNDKLISITTPPYRWIITDIDNFDNINSVMIMVNGELRKNYDFDEKNRKDFKNTNYIHFY